MVRIFHSLGWKLIIYRWRHYGTLYRVSFSMAPIALGLIACSFFIPELVAPSLVFISFSVSLIVFKLSPYVAKLDIIHRSELTKIEAKHLLEVKH